MALALILLLLTASAFGQDLLLPPPSGPFNVSIRTSELVDRSRPAENDASSTSRRLMISAYLPTSDRDCPRCVSPYSLDKVAAFETAVFATAYNVSVDASRFKIPLCSTDVTHDPAADLVQGSRQWPLTFFSPGLNKTRSYYSELAATVASQGFIVIAIDHTNQVDIVQFPDGTTVLEGDFPATDADYDTAIVQRAADSSCVADQLRDNSTLSGLLFPEWARPQNVSKIGYWGHSFGGATAFQSAHQDARFAGALNLDGYLSGSVAEQGMSTLAILWQEGDHNRTSDPSWASVWPKLTGYRNNINLVNATHLTFSDYKLLTELAGVDPNRLSLGSLNGGRAIDVIAAYVKVFFEMVLQDKGPGLLTGPSSQYPEVTFVPPDDP